MSLRMPRAYTRQFEKTGVDTALNVEIMEEKAASLGRAGKLVEKTLAALYACDAADPSRPAQVQAAADALYAYLIQRELCGLRDQEAAIRSYNVPTEVVAILGSH